MKQRKKNLWMGMLAVVLGMAVAGCDNEPIVIPTPDNDEDNTIDLSKTTNLGTMTESNSGWRKLLDEIYKTGKDVNLDLSACTMTGTVFNPDPTVETGKKYIVSIILPAAATSIEAGTSSRPTFAYFRNLESVSGANIIIIDDYNFYNKTYNNDDASLRSLKSVDFPKATTIGGRAFSYSDLETANFPRVTTIGECAFSICKSLKNANFPQVTTIGEGAFSGCSNLLSLNIPNVTEIGSSVFGSTGDTVLSITMGSAAPTLSYQMFAGVSKDKTVRVKIPIGATGYTPAASPFTGTSVTTSGRNTTRNWANGFRGGGWNGSTWANDILGDININSSIGLTIQQQ